MSGTNTNNPMEGFQGWDKVEDIDFFGEKLDGTPAEPKPTDPPAPDADKQDEAPKPADGVKPVEDEDALEKQKEEEKKLADELFSEYESDEDDDEEEEDKTKKDKSSSEAPKGTNLALFNQLRERGLINYEPEEGEEIDEERAAELIEDTYDDTIESRIETKLGSLSPLVKEMVKFSLNGGNEREFLAKLVNQPTAISISEDMNLDEEKNAEAVMRQKLLLDGNDQDFIDSNIEFMKEKGTLNNFAKKAHKTLVEKDKAERAATLAAQKEALEKRKAEQRKFRSTIVDTISKEKDINGYPISRKSVNELPDYMTKEVISTSNGNKLTQYQKDLFDALQDPKLNIVMAELVRNKFDFSAVARASKTKQTKKVQDDVRRTGSTNSSGSSQPAKRQKSLADYF